MLEKAIKIATYLKENHRKVKIVSHLDADGIAAAAIASSTLEKNNIEYTIQFVKQLDNIAIENLRDENPELIWFTDLGSGIKEYLEGLSVIITDHHKPSIGKRKGNNLMAFYSPQDDLELNPHYFQVDGSLELSGAGTTYLIANNLVKSSELATLAIVGAIGDLQDSANSKLVGWNRKILNKCKENNLLDSFLDIRFFGRETRPIFKLLEYATDPLLPTLSGREDNCIQFLEELGIQLKTQEYWRKWIDLSKAEKQKIISGIVFLLLSKGFGYRAAKRVIGEIYTLKKEKVGTELHDCKEFATLLNACGRYGQAEIGYKICLGDREKYFESAKRLLREHRKTLVDSLHFASNLGITKREYIQYFHAFNSIDERIIGIVVNMLLGTGHIIKELPLFGLVYTEDSKQVKISGRTSRELVARGLDLAKVLANSSRAVGGLGGGHSIAAGAIIPRGSEDEFLTLLELEIRKTITKRNDSFL